MPVKLQRLLLRSGPLPLPLLLSSCALSSSCWSWWSIFRPACRKALWSWLELVAMATALGVTLVLFLRNTFM